MSDDTAIPVPEQSPWQKVAAVIQAVWANPWAKALLVAFAATWVVAACAKWPWLVPQQLCRLASAAVNEPLPGAAP